MSEAVAYPTQAIRAMIDEAVRDESLSPAARLRELEIVRTELVTLLGHLDSRIGEAELLHEAQSIVSAGEWSEVIEAATIRDTLIERGMATPEQLDALGYISREDAEARIADGAGLPLREAWGLGALKGTAFNRRVRRNRLGKFLELPDAPEIGRRTEGGVVKRVLVDDRGNRTFVYEDRADLEGEQDARVADPPPVVPVRPPFAGAMSPGAFSPGQIDHARYFDMPLTTRIVPIEDLVPTHENDEETIGRAQNFMKRASVGMQSRRAPLAVRAMRDGTYHVLDGNATLAAARRFGWTDMPVQVVEGEEGVKTGQLSPGMPMTMFQSAMSEVLPDQPYTEARQPVADLDGLYELARRHQRIFESLLDRNVGVGDEVGAVPSFLRQGREFPRSLAVAIDNVDRNPDGAHVIVGALKDYEKARKKIASNYEGDVAKATDILRGTIMVPHASQLPEVIARMRAHVAEQGWKIEEVENRFFEVENSETHTGPFSNGYADVSMLVSDPADGMLMEVQLHTTPMWRAKEVRGHGASAFEIEDAIESLIAGEPVESIEPRVLDNFAGHDAYDVISKMQRNADIANTQLTQTQMLTRERMEAFMTQLYGAAFAESTRPI